MGLTAGMGSQHLVLALAIALALAMPACSLRVHDNDEPGGLDASGNSTNSMDRRGTPVPQEAGKVLERMLANLDPHTAPGASVNPPYVTKVYVALLMQGMSDIDVSEGLATINGCLYQRYDDPRLDF